MNRSVSLKSLPYFGVLTAACLVCCLTARADDISFEFNTPGVLPSSQGANYASITATPEASAFSASGGILHENTNIFPSDVEAAYITPPIYNAAWDFTLDVSARVISNLSYTNGFGLEGGDATHRREVLIVLENGQVLVRNSSGNNTVIPVDTTGAFHNYRVAAPAGFAAFDLFVDGNLRFSGDPYVLNASNPEFDTVEWGDLSPGGGNGAIDWDYIRLTNHAPTSVPEPGAAALFLGAACTGIIVLRRRRRA